MGSDFNFAFASAFDFEVDFSFALQVDFIFAFEFDFDSEFDTCSVTYLLSSCCLDVFSQLSIFLNLVRIIYFSIFRFSRLSIYILTYKIASKKEVPTFIFI